MILAAMAGCILIQPTFELAEAPIPVGPMAGVPTLADLDGDGDLDVAVTCGPCCGMSPDPRAGHIQVLLNDGQGKLMFADERIKLGETALTCAAGDLNHDGTPDLVVQHHSSYDVAVLIGRGKGRFLPPSMFTLHDGDSPHVHAIALTDVNNDGHLDITATLVDDHALSVHLGDGTGSFQPALGQPYFAHRHPYMRLNMTDINADGHVDTVLTDVRGGGLTVLVGSGTGMFASSRGFSLDAHTPLSIAERPLACDLADLDGDGDLDAVAFADESPTAVAVHNSGGGRFVEGTSPIALGVPTTGGRLADIDGDGEIDIIASGTMTSEISINLGMDGGFQMPFTVDALGGNPQVAIGDMNGDGALDVVTGNYVGGTVSVLLNQSR